MSLLIVGGSGYVGLHLIQALNPKQDVAYTYNSHPPALHNMCKCFPVDFLTGDGIPALTSALPNVRVVINCAAMSVPRECEENPEKAMSVNIPHRLLEYMESLKCDPPPLLIHFSTDQVYDGSKQFYVEEDETKPVNAYGRSKVEAERVICSEWKNYVILRSSIIYGPQPFVPVQKTLPVQWMDKVLSADKPVEFFHDEYRCPIFVKDIVKVVDLLVNKFSSEQKCVKWLLNLGGPDRLSRVEMAETVARVRGYDPSRIKQVSAKSVDRGVASPADISMNIDKLQTTLCIRLTSFVQGVTETLQTTTIKTSVLNGY